MNQDIAGLLEPNVFTVVQFRDKIQQEDECANLHIDCNIARV